MYTIKRSQRFKKDFKRISRGRLFNEQVFLEVVDLLASATTTLPKKYNEHALQGEFTGCAECHLGFDLLIIYSIDHDTKALYLLRIGSHHELF